MYKVIKKSKRGTSNIEEIGINYNLPNKSNLKGPQEQKVISLLLRKLDSIFY